MTMAPNPAGLSSLLKLGLEKGLMVDIISSRVIPDESSVSIPYAEATRRKS